MLFQYSNCSFRFHQSNVTTDGQCVRPSWLRTPSGTHNQMFTLDFGCSVCHGASSLTGEWVCRVMGHSICLCQICTIKYHQVWAFYISILGFAFAYVSNYLHYHDFVWILPPSCIFLLHNRKRTEFWTPDIKHGSMCAFIIYQWCKGLLCCRCCNLNSRLSTANPPDWTGISHYGPNQNFVVLNFEVALSCPLFKRR
jgi:hypothetical protein